MIFRTKKTAVAVLAMALAAGCQTQKEVIQPDPQPQEEPEPQPQDDTVHVTGVKLENTELMLSQGKQIMMVFDIIPADAYNQTVEWSTSDSRVAAISESGILTTGDCGEAYVTVITEDGGFKDSCLVRVIDEYYACGTISYDDGGPASGVVVSDGFVVTQTDDRGRYSLEACSDTRHIYFSFPSDAVITKRNDGLPDFFKNYTKGQHEYNFTLTRGSVEKNFMVFAIADPQAHNSVRSPQQKSDASRFNGESVPAINSQIAQKTLPCYGVTLGDIVYSENNRNSTGGMPTMKAYFKNINMPIFHVMGNHDYTYYKPGDPIAANSASSTINLVTQRKFEDCFGPINYSFNRGDVHFVCMKDINYTSTSTWAWDAYKGGFTDEQYKWLEADLKTVPKGSRLIVCVHIPFAQCSTSGLNISKALNLFKQYKTTIFSGHAHYYRGVANVLSSGIYEYVHNALCGQWWWSNISGDGAPNGYSIYEFHGTEIADSYFIGVNDKMNTRDYQMRIYRGNLKVGGSYAYFQWPYDSKTYLINVFAGDSRWTVKVYENGVYKGNASLMSNSKQTFASVTKGTTYDVSTKSNQDWWSIGYHIGAVGRGTTSTSYYTNMFHMWKYVASSENAKISVEAIDQYGNIYKCDEVITDGLNYPSYIKTPLNQ